MRERGKLSCKVLSLVMRHLNFLTVFRVEMNPCEP